MSLFGKWECPNCGSTWRGSIGWDMTLRNPDKKEKLNNLLQTFCGCEKPEYEVYPVMSASAFDFEESEKRKQLTKKDS